MDRWLADSVKGTVRQRTYELYESIARVHIKPAIGRVKRKALTPAPTPAPGTARSSTPGSPHARLTIST